MIPDRQDAEPALKQAAPAISHIFYLTALHAS